MKLQHRFPLFFSFLFSLLLAIVMLVVYYLFSNFRKVEFKDRLAEKAETTVKLLVQVKEVDEQVLKIIDRNSINRLYNEKTLIFNDSLRLIYASIDDATINWDIPYLNQIKQKHEVFRSEKEYDILGLYSQFEGRDYYTLIAAEDTYGQSKLRYLKILLVGAFVCGILTVWLLAFYVSRKTLRPFDSLRKQMQEINSKNLAVRVDEPKTKDEIWALSQSFNQMLDRIDNAYKSQKDFTSNASHELRTPIARIVMQLENFLKGHDLDKPAREVLHRISDDVYQLSEIISSLFLLSRIDENENKSHFQRLRLDEVVFTTASQISQQHSNFKLRFEFKNQTSQEASMEILGDENLLGIAILNLFRNGFHYSEDGAVLCVLEHTNNGLRLVITNSGTTPDALDTSTLFQMFTRGNNVSNKIGSGIGLSIVKRILDYHKASISYLIPDSFTNQIVIVFPKV